MNSVGDGSLQRVRCVSVERLRNRASSITAASATTLAGTDVKVLAADTLKQDRAAACAPGVGQTCYRFTRPGEMPTPAPTWTGPRLAREQTPSSLQCALRPLECAHRQALAQMRPKASRYNDLGSEHVPYPKTPLNARYMSPDGARDEERRVHAAYP